MYKEFVYVTSQDIYVYTNLRENMFECVGFVLQKQKASSVWEAFVKEQVFCVL